ALINPIKIVKYCCLYDGLAGEPCAATATPGVATRLCCNAEKASGEGICRGPDRPTKENPHVHHHLRHCPERQGCACPQDRAQEPAGAHLRPADRSADAPCAR